MNGRFRILLTALTLLCAVPCHAQAKTITAVAQEELAALESLHQDAVDSLLTNDFQSALRTYQDILLLEPDDDTAYTGLGQIYMVLGQLKKAHEAFQNALLIDPDNEVALAGIQKIMDPDGVEGMISRHHVDRPVRESRPSIVVSFKSWAERSKRLGVLRGIRAPQAAIVESRMEKLHIQRVQMALRNAGNYGGPIDGILTDSTMKALHDFQNKNGLENTGTVNVATWNALSGYLDAGR